MGDPGIQDPTGIPKGESASAEADSMEAVCCAYVLREAKQWETSHDVGIILFLS